MLYDTFQQWIIGSSPCTCTGAVMSSTQLLQQVRKKTHENHIVFMCVHDFFDHK